jgi:putative FmdB family regulatory protein
MPIYEFACPKCRVIYSFFSQRIQPARTPKCPKCGCEKLEKQVSAFAMPKGLSEPAAATEGGGEEMPDFDNPRVARAMQEMERDFEHLDENNPRHVAHLMKKMKDILPASALPGEIDAAIKRLEAGEDPEKIEEDMGDVFGPADEGEGAGGSGGGYARDSGLYDY